MYRIIVYECLVSATCTICLYGLLVIKNCILYFSEIVFHEPYAKGISRLKYRGNRWSALLESNSRTLTRSNWSRQCRPKFRIVETFATTYSWSFQQQKQADGIRKAPEAAAAIRATLLKCRVAALSRKCKCFVRGHLCLMASSLHFSRLSSLAFSAFFPHFILVRFAPTPRFFHRPSFSQTFDP